MVGCCLAGLSSPWWKEGSQVLRLTGSGVQWAVEQGQQMKKDEKPMGYGGREKMVVGPTGLGE